MPSRTYGCMSVKEICAKLERTACFEVPQDAPQSSSSNPHDTPLNSLDGARSPIGCRSSPVGHSPRSYVKKRPAVPRKPSGCQLSPPPLFSRVTSDGIYVQNASVHATTQNMSHTSPEVDTSDIVRSEGTNGLLQTSKVKTTAALLDGSITSRQLSPQPFSMSDRKGSVVSRSSVRSDCSWTEITSISRISTDTDSSCSDEEVSSSRKSIEYPLAVNERVKIRPTPPPLPPKPLSFGAFSLHKSEVDELKQNSFCGGALRNVDAVTEHEDEAAAVIEPEVRTKSGKKNSEPVAVVTPLRPFKRYHSEVNTAPTALSPSSHRGSAFSLSECSPTTSFENVGVFYATGCPEEDNRLKKLHYAALEIFTVEKKFVDQLDLIATQYPAFLANYGVQHGADLLKPSPSGQPHLIDRMSLQLSMVKEAHKVLLEKMSSKIITWDSRDPNMAECLKNGAALLRYCLPYLKEKKKHADELTKLLQDNEDFARATAEFENLMGVGVSVRHQLDIVHQNVVRYKILLEAYKKYIREDSKEAKECNDALAELSSVSDSVDRKVNLAEMEQRLLDLYQRLEGRFNVFQANRHLLKEGELLKQSRKDVQPRYLILFSDWLLVCKYSRTPSLTTGANFHSDFYKFSVLRIRVKAEEHGEYETHFELYTTQKSAVFIAKTKRDRDDWVKRINEARKEARELRRSKTMRSKNVGIPVLKMKHDAEEVGKQAQPSVIDGSDNDVSPTLIPVSEKYTAVWIPDPKATSCMMPGCSSKFKLYKRRHHCRECGWIICGSCVGYAPVKSGDQYVRDKVCPACYSKIAKKWNGELTAGVFAPPPNDYLTKEGTIRRNGESVVSGTVFLKNKKGGESEKWGSVTRCQDGVLVLYFYDAEFDVQAVDRYVLVGYTLRTEELEDSGRFFELCHTNQVQGNSIVIAFRIAHSGNAERWYNALNEGLTVFSDLNGKT